MDILKKVNEFWPQVEFCEVDNINPECIRITNSIDIGHRNFDVEGICTVSMTACMGKNY